MPVIMLVLLSVFPTFGTWIYFFAARDSEWIKLAYPACKVIQFGLPWAWYHFRGEHRKLFDPKEWKASVARGLLSGFILSWSILVFYFFVTRPLPMAAESGPLVRHIVNGLGFGSPAGFVLIAIFIALIHSGLEEYYYRWCLHDAFQKIFPEGLKASFLSAGVFSLHHVLVLRTYISSAHWGWIIFFTCGVFVGGMIWAWHWERSRSVFAPWMSHLLVDIVIMAIGYDLAYTHPSIQ
jgi:hypothetical protein